jgi:hypothetical protein
MIQVKKTTNNESYQKISNMGDSYAKVGWFKNTKYDNNTTVASVACTHEFGDPNKNIPVRSFMRSTANEKKNQWKDLAAALFKKSLDAKTALETFCMSVEGDIRKKITQITEPPLKESTVKGRMRKRYARKPPNTKTLRKPLIDTGLMLASISHEMGSVK